jgi:hypothetical protein
MHDLNGRGECGCVSASTTSAVCRENDGAAHTLSRAGERITNSIGNWTRNVAQLLVGNFAQRAIDDFPLAC